MDKFTDGITTFITFPGNAEEAVKFYLEVFRDSELVSLDRFEEGMQGMPGKVLTAAFRINGTLLLAMDMDEKYAPAFNWAMSLYTEFQDESEFDRVFAELSRDGTVLMGPEPVLDIRKATWVTDRFKITWQLIFR